MKKRNLKSLKLNKRSISHFKQEEVKGGVTPVITLSLWVCTKTIDLVTELVCEEK